MSFVLDERDGGRVGFALRDARKRTSSTWWETCFQRADNRSIGARNPLAFLTQCSQTAKTTQPELQIPTPSGAGLLSLHRRFELIVAALAIGAVAIMAVEAEPAAAQSAILVAGPAFQSAGSAVEARSRLPATQDSLQLC